MKSLKSESYFTTKDITYWEVVLVRLVGTGLGILNGNFLGFMGEPSGLDKLFSLWSLVGLPAERTGRSTFVANEVREIHLSSLISYNDSECLHFLCPAVDSAHGIGPRYFIECFPYFTVLKHGITNYEFRRLYWVVCRLKRSDMYVGQMPCLTLNMRVAMF